MDHAIYAAAEPAVLVRDHVTLVVLDPMRAIILRDRCLIVLPENSDVLADKIAAAYNEMSRPPTDTIRFEFEALEFLFLFVLRGLEEEVESVEAQVDVVLAHIRRRGVGSTDMEKLRSTKEQVRQLQARTQGVYAAVASVMEEDHDMFLMQLSRLWAHPELLSEERWDDHEEAEIVLETILLHTSRPRRMLRLLYEKIDSTESSLLLKLSQASNFLISVDLTQNYVAICLSFIGAVSANFGMNLVDGREQSAHWFAGITASTCLFAGLVFVIGMLVFSRLGLFLR